MGKRGRKPIPYPVHGRMMTRREVAEEFGPSESNILDWQKRHRHDDGTLATMEETWDHYDAVRWGWKSRYPGRKPKAYDIDGKKLTVTQMARLFKIPEKNFRMGMYRHRHGPVDEYRHKQALASHRAEREILQVLKEARK